MASTPIIQQYGESSLYAVPGVHFNNLFAREVNRLCADPHTRPSAIAVEIDPYLAAAALGWLKELEGDGTKKLPIMLGLMGTNRFIRASLKEKTRRLQVEMGMDLSEMSPALLHRELGLQTHELLCLSPSDSIVEALRCAIELEVPVYGVDLQGSAGGSGRDAVIRDPSASPDAWAFVLANAVLADQQRDEEVDIRRELAMAARLKTLLQKHSKVLFTGGLAHWIRISDLLKNDSLRPAPVRNVQDAAGRGYIRVVIHPALALRCINPIPGIPLLYEETRIPANKSSAEKKLVKPIRFQDHTSIFREYMDRAYRGYFHKENMSGEEEKERHKDLESLPAFEAYLKNLCLLGHRRTPHFYSVLGSARETMSPSFVRALSETFMDIPWANPEDFPECSILAPSREAGGKESVVLIRNRGETEKVYPRFLHTSIGKGYAEVDSNWGESGEASKVHDLQGYVHTWPPWDYLLTSLSLRAVTLGKQRRKRMRTQVFEGNLLEGIDVKATVRAFSRGQERYYVRELAKVTESYLNPLDGFPVVWITDDHPSTLRNWSLLYYLYEAYEPYVRNREVLARVIEQEGPDMVAIIVCIKGSSLLANGCEGKCITVDQYCGLAAFHPVCWTNRQIVHWAEKTQFRRSPFSKNSRPASEVVRGFGMQANPNLREKAMSRHWSTTLILAVIPYAERTITVVAPRGYVIDEPVFEQARLRGISVRTVPVDSFTRDEIKHLSLGYMIPASARATDGLYSMWVEAAIGQSQTENRGLVPPWVLDYGLKHPRNGRM